MLIALSNPARFAAERIVDAGAVMIIELLLTNLASIPSLVPTGEIGGEFASGFLADSIWQNVSEVRSAIGSANIPARA